MIIADNTEKNCFKACSALEVENGQCTCLNKQSNSSNNIIHGVVIS